MAWLWRGWRGRRGRERRPWVCGVRHAPAGCWPRIASAVDCLLSNARTNLLVSLELLGALQRQGLRHVVVCPGSRSGPLAIAAGGLARCGQLTLFTAIDERSAAFLALGLSLSTGTAAAVITTSGTAVANLLPAAVEADRSCLPLLLLTADRPARLKNRGANQTVNQEEFLRPVCRLIAQGPADGLHLHPPAALDQLAAQAWQHAHHPAGPVHLNLPFEEPLHASAEQQALIWADWSRRIAGESSPSSAAAGEACRRMATSPQQAALPSSASLDPEAPGVVIAGPWRGSAQLLPAFQRALREWQRLSGWPLLADPLAAVGADQPGLIRAWELLLPDGTPPLPAGLQVLRLGPLPASRRLEQWLTSLPGRQLLITEAEQRPLDPLNVAEQFSEGLDHWWQRFMAGRTLPAGASAGQPQAMQNQAMQKQELLRDWQSRDGRVEAALDQQLPLQGAVSEPALAHWLARLLPQGLPVMLAASSPVRDWLVFAGAGGLQRRCFSARGASGIDGTLSLAMGLALAHGPTVLVSGDLALLHDSNGWLHAEPDRPPLVVVLIDNGGGGLFQQLPIETEPDHAFETLFTMPQRVDQIALAAAHGIGQRQIACLEDLPDALSWALAQNAPVLLRVCTDRSCDLSLRKHLRMVSHNGDQ